MSTIGAARGTGRWLGVAGLVVGSLAGAALPAEAGLRLVSPTLDGTPLTGTIIAMAMSGAGGHVAFTVNALNMAEPCTVPINGFNHDQVFVRDVEAGTTACVSVVGGAGADSAAIVQSMSADGRLAVFISKADNLVPGCGANEPIASERFGVFVHDASSGTVRCASAGATTHAQGGYLSGDGRFVAFHTASPLDPACANGQTHVVVRDLDSGAFHCASRSSSGEPGNGESGGRMSMSADGRFVTFISTSTNLASPCVNGSEDRRHTYVHDTQSGTTTCVSVSTGGLEAETGTSDGFTAISGDGRQVAFASRSSNLDPACQGSFFKIFVRDVAAGTTRCVTLTPAGRAAGGHSSAPYLSGDGRILAFASQAPDLDPTCANGNSQLFARDLLTGATGCLSVNAAGEPGDRNDVGGLVLSADGRRLAFVTRSGNLVPGDTNDRRDAFLADVVLPSPQPTLVVDLNGAAFGAGQTLVVTATLVPGTTGGAVDAYVVVQLPDQSFLSVQLGGAIVPGLSPTVAGLVPVAFAGEVFRYTFTGIEPPGLYRWLAGLTLPGTLSVQGSISERPFTVGP